MFIDYLKEIPEYLELAEVFNTELGYLLEFKKLLLRDFLIDTASSDAISRYEKSLNIVPVGDIEDRKATLKSRMHNNKWLNRNWLSDKILSYVEVGSIVGTSFDMKTDTLTLLYRDNTSKSLAFIYEELRCLIPSHILLRIKAQSKEDTKTYAHTLYRELRREV